MRENMRECSDAVFEKKINKESVSEEDEKKTYTYINIII